MPPAESTKRIFGFTLTTKWQRGFTLIELLVAVAILAVLATLGLGSYIHQTMKARDAKRKTDIQKFRVALEDYYNDFECYPPAASLGCNPGTGLRPYIPKVPCEPKTNTTYIYVPASGSCPNSYWFYSRLEYLKDPDIAASGCSGGCGPDGKYNYRQGSTNAQ